MLEHVGAVGLARAHVRFDLAEDRLLGEVETDHVGHEGIEALVVRHTVARRVRECDVALRVGAQKPSHAEEALGPEGVGVERIVVHPAVDDRDRARPPRGLRKDPVVLDEEVATLHELAPHVAREKAVLEVGRVVRAGCQEDGEPLVVGGGCAGGQRLAELGGIHLDGLDVGLGEDAGEDLLHHHAVLEHVGDTGRRAQIILEHPELAVDILDQVDTRDVDVYPAGRTQSAQLLEVADRPLDELPWHDALFEDALLSVDVLEELVERPQTLHEPELYLLPLGGGHDTGDQVEREDALGSALVRVDGERDAALEEGRVGELLPGTELVPAKLVEEPHHVRDRCARLAVCGEELVVGARHSPVATEERRRRLTPLVRHDPPIALRAAPASESPGSVGVIGRTGPRLSRKPHAAGSVRGSSATR